MPPHIAEIAQATTSWKRARILTAVATNFQNLKEKDRKEEKEQQKVQEWEAQQHDRGIKLLLY